MALPLSVAVVSLLMAPFLMGERILYLATGISALAAFFWGIAFGGHWMDCIVYPFLIGLTAWCFWRVFALAGWRVPESLQPIPALMSIASLVFSFSFVAALWLTFVQRLGLPQLHQQQYLWRAAGEVLEWALKRGRPQNGVRPIFSRSQRRVEPELPEREKAPIEELTELELFLMLIKSEETLTRDKLAGKFLANGKKLSKNAWARCIEELAEQGYVENGGSGYEWALNENAQTALESFG